MRDYHQLLVWEKSHQLTLEVYQVTKGLPSSEQQGLTREIRQTCAAIPAAIAEGCSHESDDALCRALQDALDTSGDLAYHLLLARDLGYMAPADYVLLAEQLAEVRRLLVSLVQKLHNGAGSTRAVAGY